MPCPTSAVPSGVRTSTFPTGCTRRAPVLPKRAGGTSRALRAPADLYVVCAGTDGVTAAHDSTELMGLAASHVGAT